MRAEIPVCQKCCICLPLRYGLIIWGYIRLIFAGFVFVTISFIIDRYIQLLKFENSRHRVTILESVVLCLAVIIVIADIILGIIFIVGCHKKNATLITKYYHHNIFLLAILIPLCVYTFVSYLHSMFKYSSRPLLDMVVYSITDFIGLFAYVVIQIYVVLLVRSEIIKLKQKSEFRFANKLTVKEFSLDNLVSSGGKVTENMKVTTSVEEIRHCIV